MNAVVLSQNESKFVKLEFRCANMLHYVRKEKRNRTTNSGVGDVLPRNNETAQPTQPQNR